MCTLVGILIVYMGCMEDSVEEFVICLKKELLVSSTSSGSEEKRKVTF